MFQFCPFAGCHGCILQGEHLQLKKERFSRGFPEHFFGDFLSLDGFIWELLSFRWQEGEEGKVLRKSYCEIPSVSHSSDPRRKEFVFLGKSAAPQGD